MKNISICIFCFSLMMAQCFAHHPGIAVGGSGADCSTIITITPETLPRCGWSAGIQEQCIKFDTWSTETLEKKAQENPDTDVETMDYISQTSLFFSYGIRDNLMITLNLPYISFTEIRHAEPVEGEPGEFHVHNQGDSNGLGDLSVLLTWKFFHEECAKTSAAFLFGSTVPTGRTNIKDVGGELFEGDHQPGTGSFNPIVGLAGSKIWGRSGVYGNVLYTNRTEGPHQNRLGDIFNYNFSLAHQLRLFLNKNQHSHQEEKKDSVALDVLLEFGGIIEGKDRLEGEMDPNSGGHSLYIYPGIRILSGTRGLNCGYISLGLPIYQKLYGVQTKTKLQTLFGFSIAF